MRYEEPLPPDGQISFLHRSGRGELAMWLAAPKVLVCKYRGHSDARCPPFPRSTAFSSNHDWWPWAFPSPAWRWGGRRSTSKSSPRAMRTAPSSKPPCVTPSQMPGSMQLLANPLVDPLPALKMVPMPVDVVTDGGEWL